MSSFISRIEDTLRYARDELSNEDGTMQARLEAAGYVQAALEKLAVFEDPPPPLGQEQPTKADLIEASLLATLGLAKARIRELEDLLEKIIGEPMGGEFSEQGIDDLASIRVRFRYLRDARALLAGRREEKS